MQVNELNAQVVDLRRRLEEANNAKRNLGQITATVAEGSTTRSGNRNIKARAATIILKRIAEAPVKNLPAKRSKEGH